MSMMVLLMGQDFVDAGEEDEIEGAEKRKQKAKELISANDVNGRKRGKGTLLIIKSLEDEGDVLMQWRMVTGADSFEMKN